jgi:phage recombination protein Bet
MTMSNVAKINHSAVAVTDGELINVLRSSLYPGAAEASVNLVLSYCKAAGLDPMQKPVHIVPMYSSAARGYVDQIMPGIGLYRIQASRTGQYAGVSEPEFGPDVTEAIGGQTVTYPAWCKVSVKRAIAGGQVCEFVALERWKENFATMKDKTTGQMVANSMWSRRPYAQLAKCAEAQALRKAFPEVGSQPTADEMEGKELIEARDVTPAAESIPAAESAPSEPSVNPPYSESSFSSFLPRWQRDIESGKKTPAQVIEAVSAKFTLSETQIETINSMQPIEGEIV